MNLKSVYGWCLFMIDVRYEIKRLREVKSHYNYRLVKPQKNLTCKEQCEAVNGFQEYYESYKDDMLGCSIKEAKKGWFK